jgi:hypothetical protein
MKKNYTIKTYKIGKIVDSPKVFNLARYADRWFIENNFVNQSVLNRYYPAVYATCNDKLAGFILYSENDISTDLDMVFISKRFRGLGLLKIMLDKVPGNRLQWGLHKDNIGALMAYLSVGATIKQVDKKTLLGEILR